MESEIHTRIQKALQPNVSEELTCRQEEVLTSLRYDIGASARRRLVEEESIKGVDRVRLKPPILENDAVLNIENKSANIVRQTRSHLGNDEQLLLFGSLTGHVYLWNLGRQCVVPQSYSLQSNEKHAGRICSIDASMEKSCPSNTFLTSTASTDGEIKIWKDHSECCKSFSHTMFRNVELQDRKILFNKFHPTSQGLLLSSAVDGSWAVWDIAHMAETPVFHQSNDRPISCTDILIDGSILACGDEEGTINLWDVRNGQIAHKMRQAHNGRLTRLHFHPTHGHMMFTGGPDGLLKIWNLRYPKLPERCLAAHSGIISDIRTLSHPLKSVKDEYIITSGFDCHIKVWDLGGALTSKTLYHSEDQKEPILVHQGTLRSRVTSCESIASDISREEGQTSGVSYSLFGVCGAETRRWTFRPGDEQSTEKHADELQLDDPEIDELEQLLNEDG